MTKQSDEQSASANLTRLEERGNETIRGHLDFIELSKDRNYEYLSDLQLLHLSICPDCSELHRILFYSSDVTRFQAKSVAILGERRLERLKLTWRTIAAAISVACLLLVVFFGVGKANAQVQAGWRTVAEAEKFLNNSSGRMSVVEVQSLDSSLALARQGLQRWAFFLTGDDRRQADLLMAKLLLMQAEAYFQNANLADEDYDPESSAGWRHARQAISELSEPGMRGEKAEAEWVLAQGLYAFGISRRGTLGGAAERMFFDASNSMIRALELLGDDESTVLKRAEIGALLAKALHKGAAVRGEAALIASGELRKASLLDSVRTQFPQLIGVEDRMMIRQLCRSLLKSLPEKDSNTALARAQIANTLGLHLKNFRDEELTREAISIMSSEAVRLEDAEQSKDSLQVALIHAQLLANCADAHFSLGDLDQQRRFATEALAKIQSVPPGNRNKTVRVETGWLLSRLVIAEYRFQHKAEKAEKHLLGRYLGILFGLDRTAEGELDFRGWQINGLEQELVIAIEASLNPVARSDTSARKIRETVEAAIKISDEWHLTQLRRVLSDFTSLSAFQDSEDFRIATQSLKLDD